ncbi:MAG: IclR family transcriptional regulator [Armatimonadota bacterium]|nr:IclR family transcriptional regulator [Armatimonadota bacterium]MDR7533418.1 IclR family transcriptional regulator [Armatimonadota bacterium]MDR7535214.1 IclR family transcriptional regulator [Armatimonadota bacterium]
MRRRLSLKSPRRAAGWRVDGTSSLAKGLRLLDAFSLERPGLTLADLTAASGLPRATVHRLLSALRGLGYVHYDPPTRQFRLGYKLLERGYLVSEQIDLRPVARPHLERLRDETGETVSLQVVDGYEGVYVEKLEPLAGFRLWTRVGMRRPLHAGCSMKVLLAHLPPEQIDEVLQQGLARLTRLTITDPEALRRDLATIRAQGYSVTFGESHDGVHGVAAPIRDHTGRVVASVSVLAPAARIPRSRIPELVEKVTEAARRISRDLGYAGPTTGTGGAGRTRR